MPWPLFDDLDPDGMIATPGDEVIFKPDPQLADQSLKLSISQRLGLTGMFLSWELPIHRIRRVVPPRPGTGPRVPDIEILEYPGFVVPQLRHGEYDLQYRSGSESGRTVRITIVPRLVVTGPENVEINRSFVLSVKIVGPLEAPALITPFARPPAVVIDPFVDGTDTPASDSGIKAVVWLDSISDEQCLTLTAGETSRKTTDSNGIAAFEFQARALGRATVRFASQRFEGATTHVNIVPHPIAPVYEDPARPYSILVAGDSNAWGQGLVDEHKISFRLARWIEGRNAGREVERLVYGHSGAVITPKADQLAADADPGNRFPGEIPFALPSINVQVERAAEDHHAQPIDLVLLDGGINDLTLPRVLFPNPLDDIGAASDALRPALYDLLFKVSTLYPFRHAGIVVHGYYPIVTDGTPFSALEALFPRFGLEHVNLTLGVTKALMVARSRDFEAHIHGAMRAAAAQVNEELGDERIVFVSPRFSPNNGLGAPNTLLWRTGRDDEMVGERDAAAQQLIAGGRVTVLDIPFYPVASIGHPNVQGAQRYADMIRNAIEDRTDLWDLTQPRGRLSVSARPRAIPIRTTTREKLDQLHRRYTLTYGETDLSFSVEACDAATDEPVEALVYISSSADPSRFEFLGKAGQVLTHHFEYNHSSLGSPTPAPKLVICRRLYQDETVQLNWDLQPGL